MRLKLALPAMAAFLALVGCSKKETSELPGGGVTPSTEKSVYLQLDGNVESKTRSTEPSAHNTKAELYSAAIYFVDGSTDARVYAVKTIGNHPEAYATIDELTKGVKFEKIPNAVKQVYVVGNYNSSDAANATAALPLTEGIYLSDVKKTLLDIQQANYPRIAGGSDVNNMIAVMDGIGTVYSFNDDPQYWEGTNTPGADDYYATVSVKPVSARVEISKLDYTGTMNSLQVAGIFGDNYFGKMPLSLDKTGQTIVFNGSDEDKYTFGHANYAYGTHTTMADLIDQTMTVTGQTAALTPSAGKVWAYQFFGEQTEIPRVVVRFSSVKDGNNAEIGDRYITVKGYRNTNGELIDKIERGKIYQIASLAFTDNDLTILPNLETIELWVVVKVEDWLTLPVTPEL